MGDGEKGWGRCHGNQTFPLQYSCLKGLFVHYALKAAEGETNEVILIIAPVIHPADVINIKLHNCFVIRGEW